MRRKTVGIIGSALTEGPGAPGQRVNNRYVLAVAQVAAAQPLVIPSVPGTEDIGHLVDILDGIVLTGARPNVHPSLYGAEPTPAHEPYDEGRDAVALPLIRAAVEAGVAVFGICRGFQEMAVAYGATLHPEIRELPGRLDHRMPAGETEAQVIYRPRHKVLLELGGVFAKILGAEEVTVNSLHGQGILEAPARLHIEGRAEDGTPEALVIDGTSGFALGVQWHAEYGAATDPVNRRLWEAFRDAL